MIIYYILVIVPFLAVLFRARGNILRFSFGKREMGNPNNPGNTAIALFFVMYFLILALRRYDVGADVTGYLAHFERAHTYGIFDYLKLYSNEHGFYLFNKLVSLFIANEQVYIALVAAITVFPLMYLYYKETEDQMLTLSFFIILPVFVMLFSGLRQSFAIAAAVPAYYYVKARKPKQFALIVLCAFMFHQSSLILALMYPVYHMNLTRKKLIWIVPMISILYIFNAPIYLFLVGFMGTEYIESYGVAQETDAYMMLLLFVLCLIFSYFMLDDEYSDSETIGLRNILVLVTALQCFSDSNSIASRMNYYFMIFVPLLIPKIINRTSYKNRRICYVVGWVMIAYFIFYFFRRAHTGVDILETYPYYPFWQ